jgi:ATP-binding cassette subfamily B multidrug efflux pump
MIFRWFESLIDAFREPVDTMPPASVWRFYTFYLRQVWPVFVAAIVVGFGVAIVEVALFGFIGSIVDMAKGVPGSAFFQQHGRELVWMAVVALVARPILNSRTTCW